MNKSKINSTNMKKFNLFAYATLAGLALSFAACTDDDPEISKPGPQIDRGENAVSNLSF